MLIVSSELEDSWKVAGMGPALQGLRCPPSSLLVGAPPRGRQGGEVRTAGRGGVEGRRGCFQGGGPRGGER